MKKLYFVFDQLPNINDGGLISTYINLYDLLKEKYDIHIISIFNFETNTTPFDNNKIHIINNYLLDNRFYKLFSHLKKLNIKKTMHCFNSLFVYFFSIKSNRKKVDKLIKEEDLIIVSCPSAGIFMPKDKNFITEIHTSYKYFFGNNLLGKLQGKLMTRPTLTLFRTKYDANNAPKYLNPDYIYNFFDNTNSKSKNNKDTNNKLCFVGRIEEVKDPIRLINIAKKLYDKNKDFKLDIYGDGSLFNKCNEEIKRLELDNNVFMKGFTKDKNIYANYSALLITSKYEGLPMSIIEAKANGTPTISTIWGDSINEVINNGNDGFYTNDDEEYCNRINEVLNNSTLKKELSKNALNSFKIFSKKNAYERWIQILESYKK